MYGIITMKSLVLLMYANLKTKEAQKKTEGKSSLWHWPGQWFWILKTG
jgi:hypothetical protein